MGGGIPFHVGCGLPIIFAPAPAAGNLWTFKALAEKPQDTLRVDTKLYHFVDKNLGSEAANEISVQGDFIQNIADKIHNDNLAVDAIRSGQTIDLEARIAGSQGNSIVLDATNYNDWIDLTAMADGVDRSFNRAIYDLPDKARNAVIVLDFNEAINPANVNSAIKVEYNNNGVWTNVDGKFLISNQYQTVEFLSNQGCLDQNGQPITNSCGEKMYCLPVVDSSTYQATQYRVTVKAGLLKECLSNSDCADPGFRFCVDTPGTDAGKVCHSANDATGANYPETRTAPAGLTDAANNSFNSNSNTYTLGNKFYGKAEGPGYFINPNDLNNQSNQLPYSLNTKAANTGDDLIWTFYINKEIDLSPPAVTRVGPGIGSAGNILTEPATAEFAELMMSSSLKPGSNYRDGQCFCDSDDPAKDDCPSGQSCDPIKNKCISNSGEEDFCLENKECPNNDGKNDNDPLAKQCLNKKYVSLVDRSNSPVGWWITKENIETLPKDNFADLTLGKINHTIFAEATNYGAEFGSGVKDVYQNCFLPSEGPQSQTATGSCGATASEPYCCNGVKMSRSVWESSACDTGY